MPLKPTIYLTEDTTPSLLLSNPSTHDSVLKKHLFWVSLLYRLMLEGRNTNSGSCFAFLSNETNDSSTGVSITLRTTLYHDMNILWRHVCWGDMPCCSTGHALIETSTKPTNLCDVESLCQHGSWGQ